MKHSSALVFLVLAFLTFFTITSMANAEAEASPQGNAIDLDRQSADPIIAPPAIPITAPRDRIVNAERCPYASAAATSYRISAIMEFDGVGAPATAMPVALDTRKSAGHARAESKGVTMMSMIVLRSVEMLFQPTNFYSDTEADEVVTE
ncbi:hypothetical protein RUND412_009014 [Rhizina undulata]